MVVFTQKSLWRIIPDNTHTKSEYQKLQKNFLVRYANKTVTERSTSAISKNRMECTPVRGAPNIFANGQLINLYSYNLFPLISILNSIPK